MLMTEYPLHYWQGKGVFTAEIYGEEFMELKVSQLLGPGNSVIKMVIQANERAGRDMGACWAELAALQKIACMSGLSEVLLSTAGIGPRSERGSGTGLGSWRFDGGTGRWERHFAVR